MILSICMMVKNEEMNLTRCLESLKDLMKDVESELIIVDTGSTDQTVLIAEKYTDKVFHHPWNDSFSDMRNITIDYATGRWILIIDADEELKNHEAITKFLLKEKSNKITCGAIKVVNVKNNNIEKVATTLLSQRLFLNDGKFHYEGVVHNIAITTGLTEEVESSIFHYGYNADDEVLMENKFKRTSALLIKELESNPSNVYYRYQLSVTYHMHKEHQKSLLEIIKAYDLIKDSKKEMKRFSYVLIQLIKSYIMNNYFKEAVEISRIAIKIEPENFDIYFYMANALLLSDEDFEGVKAYEKYFDLISRYDQLEIRRDLRIQTSSNTVESYIEAYNNIAVVYYKHKMYKDAYKYVLKIITDHELNQSDQIIILQKLYIELCLRLGKIDEAIIYVNNNDKFTSDLIEFAENPEILKELDLDSLIKVNGPYGALNQLRKNRFSLVDKDIEILQSFLSNVTLISSPCNSEFLFYVLFAKLDIKLLITKITESDLLKMLNYNDKRFEEFSTVILDYLDTLKEDSSYESITIKKVLLKYVSYKYSERNAEQVNHQYLLIGLKYIRRKYGNDFLESTVFFADLTEEERFFVFLNGIMATFDIQHLIESLKDNEEVFPNMSHVLRYLIIRYNSSGQPVDDFVKLELELIDQVKLLVASDHINDVIAIVNEAIKMIPNCLFLEFIKLNYGGVLRYDH